MVPRLITILAGMLPSQYFAIAVGVLAAAWRTWLAILTYWTFKSRGVGRGWGLVAGAVFVVLPVGQQEALGNMTNLRWFCDAALVVLILGRLEGIKLAAAGVTVLLCSLSDPLAVMLAPMFVLAILRRRGAARVLPILGLIGAMIHLLALNGGARSASYSNWLHDPVELISQMIVRIGLASQYGIGGTEGIFRALGFPLVMAAVALPVLVVAQKMGKMAVLLLGSAVYLLLGTILFALPSDISVERWWGVAQPSRYCVAPCILVTIAGVLAVRSSCRSGWQKLAARVSIAVFVLAIFADAKGDRINSDGPAWSDTVHQARFVCQQGASRMATVEVTPTDPPGQWTATVRCDWLRR